MGTTMPPSVSDLANPDTEVLPALREVLDEEPKIARFINLARNVERSIVKSMSGDDLFSQEAIPRNLKDMRKQIAGENPSTLERLLAERIAVCWLQLQYYETIYAQNLKKFNIAQSEYHQKRIDKARRRYLSAINDTELSARKVSKAERRLARCSDKLCVRYFLHSPTDSFQS